MPRIVRMVIKVLFMNLSKELTFIGAFLLLTLE